MFICGACYCCYRTVDPCCPRFRISALSVSLCSCFILRRLLALSPVITTCFCLSSSASPVFCCLVSICGCSWCAFPAHLHLQPPCHLPSPPSLSTLAHSSFFSGASSFAALVLAVCEVECPQTMRGGVKYCTHVTVCVILRQNVSCGQTI